MNQIHSSTVGATRGQGQALSCRVPGSSPGSQPASPGVRRGLPSPPWHHTVTLGAAAAHPESPGRHRGGAARPILAGSADGAGRPPVLLLLLFLLLDQTTSLSPQRHKKGCWGQHCPTAVCLLTSRPDLRTPPRCLTPYV